MAGDIFAEKAVLGDGPPPVAVGVKSHVQRVVSQFRSGALHVSLPGAIMFGGRGAGKSTVLRGACEAMRQRGDASSEFDVTVFEVACAGLADRRDVWFAVLTELGHETASAIPPEKRKYTTYQWLRAQVDAELNQHSADVFVFALDDVDTLADPVTTLTRIFTLSGNTAQPRSSDATAYTAGFVATATRHSALDHYNPTLRKHQPVRRVLSVPDADAYRDILRTHVDTAFTPEGISAAAVDTVYEYCAETEHVGTTLDILRRAGEAAVAAGAETVTEAHVQAQFDEPLHPVERPSDS